MSGSAPRAAFKVGDRVRVHQKQGDSVTPYDGVVTSVNPTAVKTDQAIGSGGGVMSFIHLDDAAAATVLALDHDGPAIYNIVDDEPAPASEWTPALAVALGAKPPRHLPFWLARMVAGEGLAMMTEARGASNAKAKEELGWTLRYPSWRQGFTAAYSQPRMRCPPVSGQGSNRISPGKGRGNVGGTEKVQSGI